MLRKTIIALFAIASIGVLAPGAALARGGGFGGHAGGFGGHVGGFGGHAGFAGAHGGGFHGGGFHGGFHHGRGFGVGAFGLGLGLGYGLYDPYDYYADYGYPYYAYNDRYYDGDGCYVVRQRVHTRYGWRIRPVQVCG